MIEVEGNIWDAEHDSLIVIPTNIGWTSGGRAVMGAGLAKDATARWHGLVEWYGAHCKRHQSQTSVVRYEWTPLILFPVKPLSKLNPSMSWMRMADPELIERSTIQLSKWYETTEWKGKIAVPIVGCGNGKLKEEMILPILKKHLIDDRFMLVRRGA